MSKNTIVRESNLELLRILAILGVIILHYNNSDIGGGFTYVMEGSLNYYLLHFLEAMSISAVDLFILISGYFMCSSQKRNIIKPLKLLIQVILFREAGYIVSYALAVIPAGGSLFSMELFKGILESLIPNNYFVILYIALYFISVYLNQIFEVLDEKKIRQMIILLVLLFSIWVTLADVLCATTNISWTGLSTVGIDGSQGGYTIVNFVLMYCIGAYLRHTSNKTYSMRKLLAGYLITIALITIWSISDMLFGWKAAQVAWEYCNPLVILSAVLLFLIFRQVSIPQSRIINEVAKGCFTVFLGHMIFIPYIGVQRFCHSNAMVQFVHIVVSVILIYGVCWGIYFVYEKITSPVFCWLEKKVKFPSIDLSSR